MTRILFFLVAMASVFSTTSVLAAPKRATDFASKQYTIHSYKQFYQSIQAVQHKYHLPARDILLVFDLDNTLLRMQQYLGSPQWFSWQEALLKKKPLPKSAIAPNFSQLLNYNRLILAATRTAFVQPKVEPFYLHRLLQKFNAMVLTERSCDLLIISEAALTRHRLSFLANAIGPKGGYALPINALSAALRRYQRPICYQQGLMLVSGQDKASILRDYLHYIHRAHPPRYLFFIDDTLKNVTAMRVTFPRNVMAFHYLGNLKRVQGFNKPSAKLRVTQQWQHYYQALHAVFGR